MHLAGSATGVHEIILYNRSLLSFGTWTVIAYASMSSGSEMRRCCLLSTSLARCAVDLPVTRPVSRRASMLVWPRVWRPNGSFGQRLGRFLLVAGKSRAASVWDPQALGIVERDSYSLCIHELWERDA